MIKTEFRTYTKEVSEEVGTEMFCDFCKNKIKNQEKYIIVTSSHDDWGNDSIDSFQSSDVHEKCLQNYLKWLFSDESILCSLNNARDWKVKIETDWCNLGSDKE